MISIEECIFFFDELCNKLRNGIPQQVINRAVADNEWFTAEDIEYAVNAIISDFNFKDLSDNTLKTTPKDVAIIMAGNIPAVGFADLVYVLFSGHRAHIKTSHKDTALIEYIVSLLSALPIYKYDEAGRYDAVIATGGETANLYFMAKFAEIPSLLRSSRSSVAVLNGNETDRQLRGLSDDIFRYGGMGCRSVSLLFVPQGADIERVVKAIKPDRVHQKFASNYRYTRASLIAQGIDFIDGENFVMTGSDRFPTSVSRLNYMPYSDITEVEQWTEKHQNELQCIVGSDVPFGRAQHPSLTDYADGVDVMKFLRTI